ncbi:hypothetical protein [Ponticaulis sp.]|uniref:hypothetical protein n=1 Tax=Ponticaulis sp. TaxID=2020902 RepID=UPI000B63B471|nr:hypothetical protein [Ponticaulis sp.]MAI90919.1 hypothetical protein [Ponticaulis sp.]OUX98263.1 MAG: hypothetical protein CBB65_10780 [Hyphomonadaceae bacterium TMED5]|tara:strand:- start:24799 stop:25779 length:981 start_codon:yes stop_codon:yes gene_type:complete
MADGNQDFVLRPAHMLAKPVRLDPAFEDPDRVLDLCRESAPYSLAAKVHHRTETGKDVPWFRTMWAFHGKLVDPRAGFIFNSDTFIEGAKKSFDAKIIKPVSLMNNINFPMAAGVPHLDLPKFRGGDKFPFDLLVAMAYSGLFHDWAVPQASTICWFYRGVGGDFEYWPDGPEGHRRTVQAPIWNVGYVSDNEYMWHRVGGIGRSRNHIAPGKLSRQAKLHAHTHDDGWAIVDGENRYEYRAAETRISILWKAYAFESQREYLRFQNREHDLTIPQVRDILNRDLNARGLGRLAEDCDFRDEDSRKFVLRAYRPAPVNDDYRPIIE